MFLTKQIHLGYELGTNLPRPSPGEVLSFFGVSPVNYSDSDSDSEIA